MPVTGSLLRICLFACFFRYTNAGIGRGHLCERYWTSCEIGSQSRGRNQRNGQFSSSFVAAARKRVLILIAGQRSRFYPLWTFQRIVKPAVQAGYEVDYHAMISWDVSAAVGGNAFNAYWYRPVENPVFGNSSFEDLESYVLRQAHHHGARRVSLTIQRQDAEIDMLPAEGPSWQRQWLGSAKDSSTFVRDLHRLKQIEMLWNDTVTKFGVSAEDYDHVILTRDDSFWADDVHLVQFPDPWTIYSRRFGILCEATDPASWGPDDKALIIGGRVAGEFLTMYTTYYHNLDQRLDRMDSLEHFFWLVAHVKGIKWEMVRKDWLPYFTAQHMTQETWTEPRLCLRGINNERLQRPTDICIHPALIPYPFCEDFQLL
eukprot:TRINITY_DN37655_c0_g1_i1.p1 TRINITY_DN37655_c0_g1~~TRINITY_DN37655_c0_g1_i1.p1  ORF type:complete len:373 (+),score=25.91 TRINITY_DN37655_c0_g1_i1:100-1218(+)